MAKVNYTRHKHMEFSIIDFIIGVTLVNCVPHVVISIWGGRMLGGFGFGKKANILYGLLNFAVSISLFLSKYGVDGLLSNEMYLGGLFVVLCFLLGGNILFKLWGRKKSPN